MAPIYLGKRVVPSSLRYIENLAVGICNDSLTINISFIQKTLYFIVNQSFSEVFKHSVQILS